MSARRHTSHPKNFHTTPAQVITPAIPNPTTPTPLDFWQRQISSLFIILLITTPFLFTWFNEELFEFNKMIFVYGMSAIIGGAWLCRMIWQKRIILQRSWFDLPILAFVASQLISTVFSIHPRTSIFGYYSRFHGGLLSTFCYVILFYAAISNLTARTIPRLLKALFASALVVCFLSIPEHFGHSFTCLVINTSQQPGKLLNLFSIPRFWQNFNASCWIQDVQSRVFSTFGQPNWLAAYAITLIPIGSALAITQKKLGDRWLYGVTSVALLITLLFTKSRSGVLGLALGLVFLGVALGVTWLLDQQQLQKKLSPNTQKPFFSIAAAASLLISAVISILVFGSPYTPSLSELLTRTPTPPTQSESTLDTAPVTDRLAAGGTDSGEIRKIVWEGAVKVWQRYPLFGSGVETFAYSYYQDRPLAHNLVSEWDFLYNKAHNEFLNFLATTGAVGLFAYCSLLAALLGLPLYRSWQLLLFAQHRKKNNPAELATSSSSVASDVVQPEKMATIALLLSITAGGIALSISNFFGFSTVTVTVLLFVLPVLGWVMSYPKLNTEVVWSEAPGTAQLLALGSVAILVCALGVSVGKAWVADYLFFEGKQALRAGNVTVGLPKLLQAVKLAPNEPTFYDEMATDYSQMAVSMAQGGDATTAAQLATNAIKSSEKLTELNPVNVNFYKTQARVFLTLSQIEPSFFEPARQALKIAHELAPTDAKVLYNLSLVELSMGQAQQGLADLEKTVEIKTNYDAARQSLGQHYEELGKIPEAQAQYQYILKEIQPHNEFARARVAALATMSGELKKKK